MRDRPVSWRPWRICFTKCVKWCHSRNCRRALHVRGPDAHALASSDLAAAQHQHHAIDARGGPVDLGNSIHKMTQSHEKWTQLYLNPSGWECPSEPVGVRCARAEAGPRTRSPDLSAGTGCSQRMSTARGQRPEGHELHSVPLNQLLGGRCGLRQTRSSRAATNWPPDYPGSLNRDDTPRANRDYARP